MIVTERLPKGHPSGDKDNWVWSFADREWGFEIDIYEPRGSYEEAKRQAIIEFDLFRKKKRLDNMELVR